MPLIAVYCKTQQGEEQTLPTVNGLPRGTSRPEIEGRAPAKQPSGAERHGVRSTLTSMAGFIRMRLKLDSRAVVMLAAGLFTIREV